MRSRSTRLLPICLAMALAVLSACGYGNQQPAQLEDGGLLSGKPCSAPCFHNITPGVTTKEQALAALSSIVDLSACDRWEKDVSGVERGVRCSNFGITYDDLGKVTTVAFQPTQAITVDEVIRKYGNPTRVGISLLGVEMQPPIAVRLYFDEVGMVAYMPEQQGVTYDLQPSTRIASVAYEEPSKYAASESSAVPWKGYGQY